MGNNYVKIKQHKLNKMKLVFVNAISALLFYAVFCCLQVRDVTHENTVRFVGACVDSVNVLILSEYCPKGSLKDVLENGELDLDWNFRMSLIHDVVKVKRSLAMKLWRIHKHKQQKFKFNSESLCLYFLPGAIQILKIRVIKLSENSTLVSCFI